MEEINLESPESRFAIGAGAYRADDERHYLLLGLSWENGKSLIPKKKLKEDNNAVWGPRDEISLKARLLGGNNQVTLYSGDKNWVNTNWDDDMLFLEGGSGIARGGIGHDVIEVSGGNWTVVNGNQGNDEIVNKGKMTGTLRGGVGNDVLINFSGASASFYGDDGADIFKPNVSPEDVDGTLMTIKDFEIGVDFLDLSAVDEYFFEYIDGSTFVGTELSDDQYIAVLEGVVL